MSTGRGCFITDSNSVFRPRGQRAGDRIVGELRSGSGAVGGGSTRVRTRALPISAGSVADKDDLRDGVGLARRRGRLGYVSRICLVRVLYEGGPRSARQGPFSEKNRGAGPAGPAVSLIHSYSGCPPWVLADHRLCLIWSLVREMVRGREFGGASAGSTWSWSTVPGAPRIACTNSGSGRLRTSTKVL